MRLYKCDLCGHERDAPHIAYSYRLKAWVCHMEPTVAPDFQAGDHCDPLAVRRTPVDTKRYTVPKRR